MFCSLYVFHPFPDSTFHHSFCQKVCISSYYLFDQVTYFRYIVGKSTPFSITLEPLVSWNFSIFRGYAFFLSVTTHLILIFKIYREIQGYPDPNEPISLQNVKFCMCIYLFYFFLFAMSVSLSDWYIPYTNYFSNISIIELCRHWGEEKSLCTQFQFQSLEVYVDEILIAETTTLQHCGLIITYCLLEDLEKLVKIF